MSDPYFIALRGPLAWDREQSESFVAMFAEMGVRAVAGHKDGLVVLTIYDREAAEAFVEEMKRAGLDVTLAASPAEFIAQAKQPGGGSGEP